MAYKIRVTRHWESLGEIVRDEVNGPCFRTRSPGYILAQQLALVIVIVKSLSRVQLFATPWTVANQAPPSMRFSRQEYWRRKWQPPPVLLPGEFHGLRSLVGNSPWSHGITKSWTRLSDFTFQSFIHSVSSVAQSCPTLCNPMNCSTPGLPVHHQLPEFTQNSRPSSRW